MAPNALMENDLQELCNLFGAMSLSTVKRINSFSVMPNDNVAKNKKRMHDTIERANEFYYGSRPLKKARFNSSVVSLLPIPPTITPKKVGVDASAISPLIVAPTVTQVRVDDSTVSPTLATTSSVTYITPYTGGDTLVPPSPVNDPNTPDGVDYTVVPFPPATLVTRNPPNVGGNLAVSPVPVASITPATSSSFHTTASNTTAIAVFQPVNEDPKEVAPVMTMTTIGTKPETHDSAKSNVNDSALTIKKQAGVTPLGGSGGGLVVVLEDNHSDYYDDDYDDDDDDSWDFDVISRKFPSEAPKMFGFSLAQTHGLIQPGSHGNVGAMCKPSANIPGIHCPDYNSLGPCTRVA
eukprot:scaffold4503_cov167-Amphora_coffeaeformis.AAC.8